MTTRTRTDGEDVVSSVEVVAFFRQHCLSQGRASRRAGQEKKVSKKPPSSQRKFCLMKRIIAARELLLLPWLIQ